MKSLVYQVIAAHTGRLTEQNIPDPGPGQLMIRVTANGVCASDLPTWANGADQPTVLGHEPVGTVVATGPGVAVGNGTVVAGRIFPSFGQYAIADIADIVEIPESIDPSIAIAEPLGCVAEGLRRTPVPLGAKVAVVGLGFMGLIMIQLLRNAGVAQLTAIDPREDSRRAALANGADFAVVGADLPSSAYSLEGSNATSGFDVVVEASGSQAGLDLATNLVRPHGALSILGYHQHHRDVDMRTWNWKAIDVVNAHVRDGNLLRQSTAAALALQAAGLIDIGRLITNRYPLSRVDEAFAALQSKPDGFIKAVIDIA